MSVVAAKISDRSLTIAADSISVRGWTQRKDGSKFSKLFATHQGLIVGGVGFAYENSLLEQFLASYRLCEPDPGSIVNLLHAFVTWKKTLTEDGKVENDYLFALDGRLFVAIGWHVMEITTFEAIGAGMDYALAAMHFGHTPIEAVNAAIELSILCEGPVTSMSQPRG